MHIQIIPEIIAIFSIDKYHMVAAEILFEK
jgi:hypothetical protein